MMHSGNLDDNLGHSRWDNSVGAASLKTILFLFIALFAVCMLNLGLSVISASLAHGAEVIVQADMPRALEPRFGTDSNSAPSRGRRVHSPQLTSSMTIGQCGHLTSPRERQDCMVRASGGPWSYVPAATINGGVSTVVVSGESK